jgi:predicted transcriptional regulator
MSYMSVKTVSRTVRLDSELNQRIETIAADMGLNVSTFIRWALDDVSNRTTRAARLARSLQLAAEFGPIADQRDEMWGIGTRVPG